MCSLSLLADECKNCNSIVFLCQLSLTSADLAVSLQDYARTEIVQYQHLVSFCNTKFPGQAGTLDTSPAAGSCPTIVTGDHYVLSFPLHNKFKITAGNFILTICYRIPCN